MSVHQALYYMGKSIDLEPHNRRLKIYQPSHEKLNKNTITSLKKRAKEENCDKLIFYVLEGDKYLFENSVIYNLEGIIKGFFEGKDAYIYATFSEPIEPPTLARKETEQKVMKIVEQDNQFTKETVLPEAYTMRVAKTEDAQQMAALYNAVFETYPTPMDEPEYIIDMMDDNVYFTIIEHKGQIVSSSAADFLPAFNAAEMTDCATLHRHRNKGLLSHQFTYLVNLMKRQSVRTLFCYARSVSMGMNLISARHGFTYGGRMIRNSNMGGSLENMNVWFKNIQP